MFMGVTGDFSEGYYDMTTEDYVIDEGFTTTLEQIAIDEGFKRTTPIVELPKNPLAVFRDIRIAEKDKTPVPIPTAKSNQTTYLIAGAIALYFFMG